MKRIFYFFPVTLIVVITGLSSCKKLIEIDIPQNQLTSDKVFADTTAATAALVNIYALFDQTIDANYNKNMGMYTDELLYPVAATPTVEFLNGNLSTSNALVLNIWKNNYYIIYCCNDLITQLQSSKSIPAAMIARDIAEAKFLRSYAYFYLVNSFGAVPLLLTTDVSITSTAARTDSASVFNQMALDFTDAQNNLSVTYTGTGKVRVNKIAATAMLARLDLYQGKWSQAESNASSVINSGLYSLSPITTTFQANSSEAILQFWTQYGYIIDAPNLIPSTGVPSYPISSSLLGAFETTDLRKANWLKSTTVSGTTYYYPYKYHNRTTNTATPEYEMALRLGEQYLIRAEARAQQGNISGAVADVNIIRARAGLLPISSATQTNALAAIMQEWRVEFFTEWGHRYLDLKRTGQLNSYMTAYKSNWALKAVLLPIPQNEITFNINLIQNTGY